ncbi:hypothetical protein BFJ68_g17606 [Fusarium oxysporum]|uniref:Fungal N-terminal domain-containing protein n=1 Tax=Fusarium oxysporum TaxID=5507 RepID=A0A420NG16_FUSOX|nr:hypothetical protein BFJ71_g16282 [Fusarium oxysporum]RKK81717.1 hypothetical protein BFJ68_g17606 [Fusarium oxysporum]
MVDIIGTTASIVGLVGAAFTLVQQIQNAREKVKGESKTLNSVSKQLEGLVGSLSLVKNEDSLQTPGVAQQVTAIVGVGEELKSFFDRLAAKQKKKSLPQLIHVLKSGDKDDKELQGILDRLDRERDELTLRILVTQVGLVGNLKDGFYVAFDVLLETNEKVKEVLGKSLVLAEQLKDRSLQRTADGMILLDTSDAKRLGLDDPQAATTPDSAATDTDQTSIYDNITLGQARIMTGDVGMENWRRVVGRKTTIARNKFGNGTVMITGDVGGEAAKSFYENFLKLNNEG